MPSPANMDDIAIWARQAIGAYKSEIIKRKTTADCLDVIRKQGLIR